MREVPPARPLRLALVCDWFLPRVGGLELHLRDLALALRDAGHAVTVITPTPGADEVEGIKIIRVRAARLPKLGLLWTPAGLRALGAAVRAARPDVVHAHVSLVAPAALGAAWHARRAALPCVVTFHSLWGPWRGALRALDRTLAWARPPTVLTAVSETVAADVRPALGGRELSILPNAIAPATWRVAPVARESGVFRVVSVMRLAPRKRGAALLDALACVRAGLPPGVRLAAEIIGAGPLRAALTRHAARCGLADAVTFPGALPRAEIAARFAHADVFVLASRLEAFGLAALEARAAGLPVVALRAGGVREIIAHGTEGLLANDDAELAAHLLRLAHDPALRARLAAHNRVAPVAHTWAAAVAAHEKAYARAQETVP